MSAEEDQRHIDWLDRNLTQATAENRDLKTDNERLRTDLAKKTEDYERMWSALQAEVTTSVRVRGELRDENTRLKAQVTSLLTTLTQDECHCDPPGSGEEYCTGECLLRAEIVRLQAVVKAARNQIAQNDAGSDILLRNALAALDRTEGAAT